MLYMVCPSQTLPSSGTTFELSGHSGRTTLGQNEMEPSDGIPLALRLSEGLGHDATCLRGMSTATAVQVLRPRDGLVARYCANQGVCRTHATVLLDRMSSQGIGVGAPGCAGGLRRGLASADQDRSLRTLAEVRGRRLRLCAHLRNSSRPVCLCLGIHSLATRRPRCQRPSFLR